MREPQHGVQLALLGLREELERLWELFLGAQVELFGTCKREEDTWQRVNAWRWYIRWRNDYGLGLGCNDGLMALCVERTVSVGEGEMNMGSGSI
jgi:hypothetical protein